MGASKFAPGQQAWKPTSACPQSQTSAVAGRQKSTALSDWLMGLRQAALRHHCSARLTGRRGGEAGLRRGAHSVAVVDRERQLYGNRACN